MYEAISSLLIDILPYAMLGSAIRVSWGAYKAYTSFLGVNMRLARILVEFVASMMFGIFGGVVLSTAGMIAIGASLGTLVSSLLGANVIELIVKKFGSGKMEVIVSDQQLEFPELNQRQINCLQYVRVKGRITNREYQKINRTNRDTAKYELASLVKKKNLVKVGKTKNITYVLV
jgi:uncharacterized membrane-anchored protein YitT (DUF2179 family)